MNNPNTVNLTVTNDDPSVLNIRLLVDVNPHNTADGLVVPEGQVPLQGVAHAVAGARLLRQVKVVVATITNVDTSIDYTGASLLTASLGQHASSLRTFSWLSVVSTSVQHTSTNHQTSFASIATLPNLQQANISDSSIGVNGIRALVQSQSIDQLSLGLPFESWQTVAQEIRSAGSDSCTLGRLVLDAPYTASTFHTNPICTDVIQEAPSLQSLALRLQFGFCDQAVVALAGALAVNPHLRYLQLVSNPSEMQVNLVQAQGVSLQAIGPDGYKALGEMLKLRLRPLMLELPALQGDATPETRMEYERMRIELRLNNVRNGRPTLDETNPRVAWVQFLIDVNESFVTEAADYEPVFHVSCLFVVLQLNPNRVRA